MTWDTVPLGEVVDILSGFAFDSTGFGDAGEMPIARIRDVVKGVSKTYFTGAYDNRYVLEDGDLLIGMDGEFNRGTWRGGPALLNQRVCNVAARPDRVDARFLYHVLPAALAKIEHATPFVTVKHLSVKVLRDAPIPLPPLPEQRRIAAILDEADGLRALQRHSSSTIAEASEAAFRELELSLAGKQAVRLDDIAIVGSGITKGRKAPNAALSPVDYLTVANVQDKRLDLSVVKQIHVSERELERYRLQRGDLLLTEGGDPDKLGRGVVWNEELTDAIHQNHVFRVRLRDPELSPLWLSWEVGSAYGKAYFLRMAKQTTGIATINSTQLRGFPVRIPGAGAVERFLASLESARFVQAAEERRLKSLDALFASLQHRAFRGEL